MGADMATSADVNKRQTDLAHLHPIMRSATKKVLAELAAENIPFKAFEVYRSPRRQRHLYAQGRTAPGKIVTNAKAWGSYHQYGLGVDFVLFINNNWSWDDKGAEAAWWKRLHEIGRKHGLEALSFELPHLQVAGLSSAQLRAGNYPAGGDKSWAEHLEANIIDWGAGAPPVPSILPERPPLEGGILNEDIIIYAKQQGGGDGFDEDGGFTKPPAPPAPSGAILTDISLILPFVEQWEGGYVDHPADKGGPTNMGITLETLARWRGHAVTAADVKALTRAEARQILTKQYFVPIRAGEMPSPVALFAYNISVMSGPGRAGEMIQRALINIGLPVELDGDIGNETIGAVLRATPLALARAISDAYEQYLRDRPNFNVFGKGWMNRVNAARAFAIELAAGSNNYQTERETQPVPQTPIPQTPVPQTPLPPYDFPLPPEIKTFPPGAGQLAELVAAFEAFRAALRRVAGVQTSLSGQTHAPNVLADLGSAIEALSGKKIVTPGKEGAELGPVSGALGQTIGNLLNGRKSAIGILGSLATTFLSPTTVASADGVMKTIKPALVNTVTMLEPLMAIAPGMQPVFLAMTAWGFLSKMEKWSTGGK
ncbi:MAG: glycosyl hydrolase 108 family protein [Bosea sp. (in: a-proteobacteria)]